MQFSSISLHLLSMAALIFLALLGAATAGPTIPTGYKSVVFHDDFTTQSVDRGTWKLNTGTAYPGGPANWGTCEIQTYTDSPHNVHVRNETLVITPLKDDTGKWTSARLETKAEVDFACPRGGKLLVEARIKLGDAAPDSQAGIWPAFWLLGSAYRGVHTNWPSVGEVDIMESVNGLSTTWGTVHCGDTAQGGPCNEPIGIGSEFPLLRQPWNVFSVEIDRSSNPQRMAWSVNGFPFMSLTSEDVGDKAWEALAGDSKMMLLNVAVGGAFPNAIAKRSTPDGKTRGGEGAGIEVDYVAVYST